MAKTINLEKKEIERLRCLLQNISTLEKNEGDMEILKKLDRALRPIKISSRKSKGRNLQKWVCEQISKLTGIPYDQSDDQCLIHSREMGQSGVDIILRGDALRKFSFSVECKNSKQLKLMDSIEQAKKNNISGNDWLIVYKNKQLKEPIVIMDWMCFYYLRLIYIDHLKKIKLGEA